MKITTHHNLLDSSTLFHPLHFLIPLSPPKRSITTTFQSPILNSLSLSLSLCLSLMAAESGDVSSMMDQLRSSFLPILIGLMGPGPDSDPDRLVLVNPVTQGMIVLRGDASTISEILSSGGGGSGGGAPPASKASIEALEAVEVEDEEEECSVCLEGLKEKEGELVKEMPCKHRFHGGCIEKWLKMHGSCPVCRFAMPKEEGGGGNKEEREREVWVTIAVRRSEREGGDRDQEDEEQQQE